MGMVKHVVTIKHVYQDKQNPDLQEVVLDCDYATAYAFFMALITKGLDFEICIHRESDKG